MTSIGMAGDFIYGNNEYALRTFSETDYHDDEVVNFNSRLELENYIKHLMKSPNAWPAFGTVANLYLPNACIKSVKECDQEIVDFICDKLLSGDMVLVIRKFHDIKNVKLEECCVKVTGIIQNAISSSAMISAAMIALPFFEALLCPPPKKAVDWATAAFSILQEDWKLLSVAVKSVNKITRRTVYEHAVGHSVHHHNSRKLKQLWKEVSDVFA